MRPTRLTLVPAVLVVAVVLTSCASGDGGAADGGARSSSPVPSPRVPLLNDALLAEACALPQLPVDSIEQRAELKRRSLDVSSRHAGVQYPRRQRTVWTRVHQLHTLADLRPGETFFGSPHAAPTLLDGTVLATTLEEGLSMLEEECSAL